MIGNTPQDNSPRETEDRAANADTPLNARKRFHAKRSVADENNHDLSGNHQDIDSHKPVVSVYSLEDVEPVVETSIVEFVENLHPNEGIENDRVHLRLQKIIVFQVVAEDTGPDKVKNEGNHQLVDRLADDHLPHVWGKEWGTFRDRFAV